MADTTDLPARLGLLHTLDLVLRGSAVDETASGPARVHSRNRRLIGLALLLGAIYGASLGAYGLCHHGDRPALQMLCAALKLPLLFGLTLLVTFPSLYVFATLMKSPLGGMAALRQLLSAVVVHLAVLASLGPVFAFFAVSTESYPFLLLLHVLFCAVGGLLSLRVLHRNAKAQLQKEPDSKPPPGQRLLTVWCLLYGTVGAQMGWLLRPFLGEPGQPFAWFCPREGSVLTGLFSALSRLLHHG